jgi:hypothetical protein
VPPAATSAPGTDLAGEGASSTASPSDTPSPTTEPTLSPSPASTVPTATPQGGAGNYEWTTPGTTLKFGAAALVPWTPTGGAPSPVQLTVSDVVQGDAAGSWFVQLEVTTTPYYAGKPIPGVSMSLLDQNGNDIPPFTGTSPSCERAKVPTDNSTIQTCIAFAGDPSQVATRVLWDNINGTDMAYDQTAGHPITWTRA